ncbi:hypothetical protein ABIA26_004502 [Sinorhizobium fredii]
MQPADRLGHRVEGSLEIDKRAIDDVLGNGDRRLGVMAGQSCDRRRRKIADALDQRRRARIAQRQMQPDPALAGLQAVDRRIGRDAQATALSGQEPVGSDETGYLGRNQVHWSAVNRAMRMASIRS